MRRSGPEVPKQRDGDHVYDADRVQPARHAVSSLLFFAENLGDPRPTDRLRKVAASQVISLLQWVENKNARKRTEEARKKGS